VEDLLRRGDEMVENERKDDNTGDSGGKSPKKLRVLLRTFG